MSQLLVQEHFSSFLLLLVASGIVYKYIFYLFNLLS